MTTPKEYPFKVEFFLLNEDDHIVAFAKANAAQKEQWGTLQSQLAEKCEELFGNPPEQARAREKRLIRILFLNVEQLSGTSMLNVLANAQLEKFAKKPKTTFAPMITVGTYDIMSLYAYPYEREMAEGSSSKIFRSLTLDPRYKFLDSSIWFRYIPLIPLNEDESLEEYHTLLQPKLNFINRATALLNEICNYWTKGLYYTNAAVATLELQLRLLLQSHITDKIGDGGHAEAVTPFKFHSESFLQKRSRQEKDFLEEPWDNTGVSIGSECKLKALIVDDQAHEGYELSTIDDDRYQGCTISKKDLILAPLLQVFSGENIDISTPNSDKNVIEQCLQKIEKRPYDLIFLDYLLGKRVGTNGLREYGHEFLLNLLNDSKDHNFNYKRGFQGRFWIFSISSFPFALPDKLHQLGISNLQNLWHLSYGGDPITTPHLYAYYLFRFIKQKVSTYFLHPVLLLRILKENPVEVKEGNERFWAEYLENTILNWQQQIHLASRYAQDEQSAGFTESIAWFCKQNYPLNKTLELILKITVLLKKGYVSDNLLYIYGEEFKQKELEQFETVRLFLWSKIALFQDFYTQKQKERISQMGQKRMIDLSYQKIHHIPNEFFEAQKDDIKELLLGSNYLESFPPTLLECKKLSRIDLSNNPITTLEGDIEKRLLLLTDLNLENTPIAEKLNIVHAQNRAQVLQLWKEARDIQKYNTIKKVLFFGISPEQNARLRVDLEFKKIKAALKGERFELLSNQAVSYIEFQREVLRSQAKIVHFAGHGMPDELLFEQGKVNFSTVLKSFFTESFVKEHLQCVILNACYSENQAKKLSSSIPGLCAVGSKGPIPDELAISFAEGFYNGTHLIEDGDYPGAFRMGINAMESTEDNINQTRRDTGNSFGQSKEWGFSLWFDGKEIDGGKGDRR